MASYMLVRHKVRDFSEWKVGYDGHRSVREEAGLTEVHLLHNADDPSEVITLFETKNLDKAKAFAISEALPKTIHKVDIVDLPDIYFLSE